MIKRAPTLRQLLALTAFGLSTFGLLLWLWLTFGGSIPLKAESYRFSVAFPEATGLAPEADVRIAGVNVGKVKRKEPASSGRRTIAEIELDPRYAPIPADTRALLREKTLLGETYVQLSHGSSSALDLADGGRLDDGQVQRAVQLDELAGAFDAETRRSLGDATTELGQALSRTGAADLNASFGNLVGFAAGADDLVTAMDAEKLSLRRLVRNTGIVFESLTEQKRALRTLVREADTAFGALAANERSLVETMRIAPTFLVEARETASRAEATLIRAEPLLDELGPAADDLGPTLRDLAAASPDLEETFRRLKPLFRASKAGLPAAGRTIRASLPLMKGIHPFASELNPILSLLSFYQERVAGFVVGPADLINSRLGGQFANPGVVIIDPRSFMRFEERPEFSRGGSAYPQPNYLVRRMALGMGESFDCSIAPGRRNRFGDVKGVEGPGMLDKRPPCLVAPRSLYDDKLFQMLGRGEVIDRRPPTGTDGKLPLQGRP